MATTTPMPPAPMPPVPTKEVFCLKIIGSLEGQLTVNTLYYASTKSPQTATIAEQLDLMEGFTNTGGPLPKYLLAVSIDWLAEELTCYCPTNPALATAIQTLTPQKGTVALPRLPNHSAVTLPKITTLRGKHGRGRISVPGVPSAWVTGTSLTNVAAHTNLSAYLASTVAGVEDTYTPGIFARKWDPVAKVWILGWQPLRGVNVNTVLGTCRRRKPGVGK